MRTFVLVVTVMAASCGSDPAEVSSTTASLLASTLPSTTPPVRYPPLRPPEWSQWCPDGAFIADALHPEFDTFQRDGHHSWSDFRAIDCTVIRVTNGAQVAGWTIDYPLFDEPACLAASSRHNVFDATGSMIDSQLNRPTFTLGLCSENTLIPDPITREASVIQVLANEPQSRIHLTVRFR